MPTLRAGPGPSADRLLLSLTTLIHSALQTLPDEKQDAASITGEVIGSLIFSAGSVYHPLNLLTRVDAFPKLLGRLKSDAKGLIRDLEKLQETSPHVACLPISHELMIGFTQCSILAPCVCTSRAT